MMNSTLNTITSIYLSLLLYANFYLFIFLSNLLWEALREQLLLIINNGRFLLRKSFGIVMLF